jgi:hypothetical protein
MNGSDQELLEGALRGDEDAFAALYRLRQGVVYRFALHMAGSATRLLHKHDGLCTRPHG